ncbi:MULTISPECIES: hypothetical protein [unclassified Streptomyces]|uniref:Uncharacterized protein n=1 Tax=Streptomyces sp. NBC_00060 TaxID=2975636 RepID=A0AAU2HG33_9ACTN
MSLTLSAGGTALAVNAAHGTTPSHSNVNSKALAACSGLPAPGATGGTPATAGGTAAGTGGTGVPGRAPGTAGSTGGSAGTGAKDGPSSATTTPTTPTKEPDGTDDKKPPTNTPTQDPADTGDQTGAAKSPAPDTADIPEPTASPDDRSTPDNSNAPTDTDTDKEAPASSTDTELPTDGTNVTGNDDDNTNAPEGSTAEEDEQAEQGEQAEEPGQAEPSDQTDEGADVQTEAAPGCPPAGAGGTGSTTPAPPASPAPPRPATPSTPAKPVTEEDPSAGIDIHCVPAEKKAANKPQSSICPTDPKSGGPGRQGRSAPTWAEGPGLPSAQNPGAVFTKELYERIANLKNDDFVRIRDRVLQQSPSDPGWARLQRSFYANGCTGVSWVSQQTLNACLQHDFRYTAGPNLSPGTFSSERDAANVQLGDNVGGGTGWLAKWLTKAAGGLFYSATPTAGRPVGDLFGIMKQGA